MNRDKLDSAALNRRADALAVLIAVGLATLIVVGAFLASAALAEEGRTPASEEQLRLEAPIGHRQPRPADLPPSVRRDEGTTTSGERTFDKKLEICREC